MSREDNATHPLNMSPSPMTSKLGTSNAESDVQYENGSYPVIEVMVSDENCANELQQVNAQSTTSAAEML